MSSKRLRVPLILAVTGAVLASCTPVSQPQDGAGMDTLVADASDDMDACPDPLACYMDFQYLPDGGLQVIYRRMDGGISTNPCPPPTPNCPVV